jgi:hypothetical protein
MICNSLDTESNELAKTENFDNDIYFDNNAHTKTESKVDINSSIIQNNKLSFSGTIKSEKICD